jgi:hypothetical protein
MSSPFPRDKTINAAIPVTIKALMAIPEYFTNFKNVVESCFIEHLMMVVAFSLMISAEVSKRIQRAKPDNPSCLYALAAEVVEGLFHTFPETLAVRLRIEAKQLCSTAGVKGVFVVFLATSLKYIRSGYMSMI